ncbi:MAG: hypothetical protein V9H26_14260 [Verrucomicrobiota bacterium]
MKTKVKSVSRTASGRRAVAPISSRLAVPLRDRCLTFGNQWDFAPAPEDSKNYAHRAAA